MELNKDNNLQNASKIISKILKVDNVLCFGKNGLTSSTDSIFLKEAHIQNRVHYHLMVISETAVKNILHLQEEINSKLDNSVSVSLIVHTKDEIAQALADGSRLFHKIFQKADERYLHSHFKTLLCSSPAPSSANALMLWQDHYDKAVKFHESAENLLGIDDNSASLYLIIQSLECASSGLLQSCLDYQPKNSDLTYLLPLCDVVSSQFEYIFPRNTPASQRDFQLLSKDRCFAGNNAVMPESALNVFFLHQQCKEWLNIARTACQTVNV